MASSTHYDSIVLGAGGVGTAALWHLAQRGQRVLGIDRYAPPHDLGSSHGQTRIIRQAYFEHPDYTPLVLQAYQLWNELEQITARRLYHQVGVLQIGPPEGEVVGGVRQAAEAHGLDVQYLTPQQIAARWPQFRAPQGTVGALENQAGYLLVEDCVAAHSEVARRQGAELLTDVSVLSWQPGPPAKVSTTAGELSADHLVITAGPWAGPLLADLGLRFEVRRKSMFWYPTDAESSAAYEDSPCFLFQLPAGVFYGFPRLDDRGVKLAEHSGGAVVDDPLQVDRAVSADDERRLAEFQQQCLSGVSPQFTDHSVCMYTMSPDEHFVVDRHPQHPHIAFAAGLSGHGFKFTPVLGKALADLVLDGGTNLPIGFLGLR